MYAERVFATMLNQHLTKIQGKEFNLTSKERVGICMDSKGCWGKTGLRLRNYSLSRAESSL